MERQERRARRGLGWIALGPLLFSCVAGAGYALLRASHPADAPAGAHAAIREAKSDPSALDLVLAPAGGARPLDERIRVQQRRIPSSRLPAQELERLGWLFIARAREYSDAGSYRLALAAADAIEARESGSRAALLLRGHALHSLHRFREAERVARKLASERGMPHDFGLLGDVLADRGRLAEATDAYQKMMDLRPDMHAYARAAHVRYLKGDLSGALAAMELATRAASPRNGESFAWAFSKLAQYQLQAGAADRARATVSAALEISPESPQALETAAQLHLADGEPGRAVEPLHKAIANSPHPKLLWMLIESLEALDRHAEAEQVRAQLLAAGEREDPRAFALYLASRREELERAERCVRAELAERADVYTYEALGWVQSARGEHAAALQSARRSLAEGTEDARLFYHAGLIAERAGDAAQARTWLARARAGAALLLPSQRAALEAHGRAP